jgi:hypothetical protein
MPWEQRIAEECAVADNDTEDAAYEKLSAIAAEGEDKGKGVISLRGWS